MAVSGPERSTSQTYSTGTERFEYGSRATTRKPWRPLWVTVTACGLEHAAKDPPSRAHSKTHPGSSASNEKVASGRSVEAAGVLVKRAVGAVVSTTIRRTVGGVSWLPATSVDRTES